MLEVSHLLQIHLLLRLHRRVRPAGEIHREPLGICDNFNHVRAQERLPIADACLEGGDLQGRVSEERLNRLRNRAGVQQRLVPLNIDDQIALDRIKYLSQPVGAGGVVGTSEARPAAEGLDGGDNASIVGGHNHLADQRAGGGPAINMLDHRPAAQRR